jgi:putative cell wall-binding protein
MPSSSARHRHRIGRGVAALVGIGVSAAVLAPAAHAAPSLDIARVAGSDRYLTAVTASQQTFAAGSVDTVVLAAGTSTVDALASAFVAGAHDAPVLLTGRDEISAETLTELRRLGAQNVIIAGGTGVVSDAVAAQLSEEFTVERAAGADRYETAARLAESVQDADPEIVFIAGGAVDAAAASPISAAMGWPVLLTPAGAVSPDALAYVAAHPQARVVVLGGTAAVSDAVATTLGAKARIEGSDRFVTATEIADFAVNEAGFDGTGFGLALGTGGVTRDDLADALTAGPILARQGAPLLLAAAPDALGEATQSYLEANTDRFTGRALVFGGPAAISEATVTAAAEATESTPTPVTPNPGNPNAAPRVIAPVDAPVEGDEEIVFTLSEAIDPDSLTVIDFDRYSSAPEGMGLVPFGAAAVSGVRYTAGALSFTAELDHPLEVGEVIEFSGSVTDLSGKASTATAETLPAVADTVKPVVKASEIAPVQGDESVTFTVTKQIDDSTLELSDFTVNSDDPIAVTGVDWNSQTRTITVSLSAPLGTGDVVTFVGEVDDVAADPNHSVDEQVSTLPALADGTPPEVRSAAEAPVAGTSTVTFLLSEPVQSDSLTYADFARNNGPASFGISSVTYTAGARSFVVNLGNPLQVGEVVNFVGTVTDRAGNDSSGADLPVSSLGAVAGAPGAPGNVAATAGNPSSSTVSDGTVAVSWEAAPTYGSDVTQYEATLTRGSTTVETKTLAADALATTFTELPVGSYTVTVRADSGQGWSATGTDTVELADPRPAAESGVRQGGTNLIFGDEIGDQILVTFDRNVSAVDFTAGSLSLAGGTYPLGSVVNAYKDPDVQDAVIFQVRQVTNVRADFAQNSGSGLRMAISVSGVNPEVFTVSSGAS